jgi:hypothetical protein
VRVDPSGRTQKKRSSKEGSIVITLDDLEDSYPDDGDHCCYCGRKWDRHSPWEFCYLDNHPLCEGVRSRVPTSEIKKRAVQERMRGNDHVSRPDYLNLDHLE